MDTVKEGIRLNLIELLETTGKKSSDLADVCNVQRSAVSNWKSGKNSIDIELIPTICEFFDVSIDAFFSRAKQLQPLEAFSDEEEELIELYRELPSKAQRALLAGLKEYVK